MVCAVNFSKTSCSLFHPGVWMDEGRGETVSELLKVGKGWGGGGETPLYRLESLSGNSSLLHAIFGTPNKFLQDDPFSS